MQILSCVSAGLSLDYASAGNLHSNLQQNQKLLQNAMLQPFTQPEMHFQRNVNTRWFDGLNGL